MPRKVSFYDLEEARLRAGFLVYEAAEFLGISERTWYRWQEQKKAPQWSYVALSVMSGDLSELGWKGFYIKKGILYKCDLNHKYYHWEPAGLMVTVWCKCVGHSALRREKMKTQSLSLTNEPSVHNHRITQTPTLHQPSMARLPIDDLKEG